MTRDDPRNGTSPVPPPNYLPPPVFAAPPPRRRRGPILVAAAAAVLVVALVAGGTYWVLSRDGEAPQPVAKGMLRYTFPTQPTPAWTVSPRDLGGDPDDKFFNPLSPSAMRGSTGFLDAGETLVTLMGSPMPDAEFTLIGLDSSTGERRWSRSATGLHCPMVVADGALPCLRTSGGRNEGVDFIDVDTGQSRGSFTPAFTIDDATSNGSTIFFTGTANGARYYTSGTVESPTAHWSSGPIEPTLCPYGSDAAGFTYDQGKLLHIGGTSSWFVDATTGTLVDSDAFRSGLSLGDGYAKESCSHVTAPNRSADTSTVTVVDRSGSTVFEKAGPLRGPSPVVTNRTSLPVFIGDTAYDPETGAVLWESSAIAPEGHFARLTVVGDRLLVNDSESLISIDLDDGSTLWSVPTAERAQLGPTDGERILVADDAGVGAYNLIDGALEWFVPGSVSEISSAGENLAVADEQSITSYEPTGGAAKVPGTDPSETSSGTGTFSSGDLVTKCGSRPKMEPVSFHTDTGGLIVEMRIRATCPGGDILSTDALRVTVRDNGTPVASSTFDFSGTPLTLPPTSGGDTDHATARFRYPLGSFWRLPGTLGDGQGGVSGSRGGGSGGGDILVECDDEGTSSGPSTASAPSGTSSSKTFEASSTVVGVDAERASRDALREQADADAPFVRSELADRWVPLLSSKQPGLVADGVTWNNAEILREHLDLRLRYPEVRLMWSGDWSTFTERDWWVTAAGVTFSTPEGANAWCDSKGFATEHCFAKLVSTTHGVDGSTRYRK